MTYSKNYYQKNKKRLLLKAKKWKAKNPEKFKASYLKWATNNPEKVKECNLKWRANNPDKVRNMVKDWFRKNPNKTREYNLKRNFGISIKDYDLMLEKQGNRCAICKTESNNGYRNFDVDHNHTTGKIRGLLCNSCNTGIGFMQESVEILSTAIIYLQTNI